MIIGFVLRWDFLIGAFVSRKPKNLNLCHLAKKWKSKHYYHYLQRQPKLETFVYIRIFKG